MEQFQKNFYQAKTTSSLAVEAIASIANEFDDGSIVQRDKLIAVELYEVAGKFGEPSYLYKAARRYKDADGISQNLDRYLQLLRLAANVGSYDALIELKSFE
ncbi:SEL1-like repeat protein [Algicola sagamiensis]|uniref:hypothetical protein n=1 Tax=Algicola sagamiensis TaxID=163869 RepID=UPI000363BD54|nr:hypothetical protein [Algicola sagamiensis]